jgi:LacI family transcriptional regulator
VQDHVRPATLSEVARLAGVSIATASRALNGRSEVKEETRARVAEVAERLSFRPNVLARGLLEGRTGTVGLITSDLEGRFSIPVLMGAEDAFGAGKTSVFLCDARGDTIREQHHVDALLSRHVDGIIVVGSRTDPRPPLNGSIPVPVVYAYAPSEDPADLSVVSDNVQGGRAAIEHLVMTGRKRIAHITGERLFAAARDRAAGALEALESAGLELAGGQVMYGSWNEPWGRGAARMLLELDPEIDAIFCGSDQIARGAIDALHQAGKQIPRDLAVMGFDNWSVIARNSLPELSSVDMRLQELGARSARLLFQAIDGAADDVAPVDCRVVVRGSTAPID